MSSVSSPVDFDFEGGARHKRRGPKRGLTPCKPYQKRYKSSPRICHNVKSRMSKRMRKMKGGEIEGGEIEGGQVEGGEVEGGEIAAGAMKPCKSYQKRYKTSPRKCHNVVALMSKKMRKEKTPKPPCKKGKSRIFTGRCHPIKKTRSKKTRSKRV